MIYKNVINYIGNTPLVQINFGTPPTILAKLEYLNPGGSIKDRSALFMIEEAERTGLLKPGGTIIEASSGNQGIAAALIGAVKGYKVIITTNDKFSPEKINTIKAYGAQVVMCPSTKFVDDPESYHSTALKLQESTPNSFMLNQYYNHSNAKAHYSLLGPEIYRQTNGTVTHFFAPSGTCGTISGVGKYLKEQNNSIKIIAVDALNSYRTTNGNPKPYKMEGIGVDFLSPILENNQHYIDEFSCVTDEQGLGMLKIMAQHHGLLIGPSSGAVAYSVFEYSKNLSQDDVVVMTFGDSGRAYLTKGFYAVAQESEVLNSDIILASKKLSSINTRIE